MYEFSIMKYRNVGFKWVKLHRNFAHLVIWLNLALGNVSNNFIQRTLVDRTGRWVPSLKTQCVIKKWAEIEERAVFNTMSTILSPRLYVKKTLNCKKTRQFRTKVGDLEFFSGRDPITKTPLSVRQSDSLNFTDDLFLLPL